MTSSTKPEVHNISHCHQRRTDPRPGVTCTENLVKFGHVVFETCEQTVRHAAHNTLHSCSGWSNKKVGNNLLFITQITRHFCNNSIYSCTVTTNYTSDAICIAKTMIRCLSTEWEIYVQVSTAADRPARRRASCPPCGHCDKPVIETIASLPHWPST